MRFVDLIVLIDSGGFSASPEYKRIAKDLRAAINHVRWPEGADKFTIYPEPGKGRGEGNGVKPIKNGFVEILRARGWTIEQHYEIDEKDPAAPLPGAFDASLSLSNRGIPPFVAEWETGNISSSHRALNKMALGLVQKRLSGGILVLPTRRLYRFLTDRIGNIDELVPYFPMWRSLRVRRGFLGVISVEHDAESFDVPRIPKGTSGRAIG